MFKMRSKQTRFNNYDPYGDFRHPEIVGLVPNEADFDIGTPNLKRGENILLVAANSSFEHCLTMRIKWRPNSDAQTVTTISRLTLAIGDKIYDFAQVETYKPPEDFTFGSGHIMTYGSSSSKLKLSIVNPYRQARIIFNGHMRLVTTGSNHSLSDQTNTSGSNQDNESMPPRLVYVRLSCLVLLMSEIFDFYTTYDESCLRQIYAEKKLSRPFASVVSDLLLHDTHDYRVRLNGDYLLIDPQGGDVQTAIRTQKILEVSGHFTRHFLADNQQQQISTKRLYGFANNGQGFHIGTRQLDNESIDFGYANFSTYPKSEPIDKPFKLHGNLESSLQKFELQVSGDKCTFDAFGERRHQNWFKMEFNGKRSWAFMSLDDELVEDEQELSAMARCRNEQELLLNTGKICRWVDKIFPETKPLVVAIDEECCNSSDLVGAKASSLAQLHGFVTANKKPYVVPRAIVLTRYAHDLIMEQNPDIKKAIDDLPQFIAQAYGNVNDVRERCKQVHDLVASTSLPNSIAAELWQKLEQHLGSSDENDQQATFAVRSSSWGEDEADMSAAGQLSTILNVKCNLDELSKATMACFASKFSSENIEYKRQHGQPLDLPMAVVIQRMIACDMAGVMFTCDPTNGDESLVTITANYGLGESVVSGQADPDSIRVRVGLYDSDYSLGRASASLDQLQRPLNIEEVKVGNKDVVIGGHDHGAEQDKSRCCLSDEQILELARCGQEIRYYFWSQRRDIEWGYKGGRLHLFQSRPVTSLEAMSHEELLHEFDRPIAPELNFFTRANIGEVMPHALTPLTISFPIAAWNVIGYRTFSKILCEESPRFLPQSNADVVYLKYHSLFNCSNSLMLPLGNAKKTSVSRALEIGFFGREIGPRPDIVEAVRGLPKPPRVFEGFRFKLNTWQLRLMPVRTVEKELAVMHKLRADIKSLKYAKGYEHNKMLGLYNQMFCSSNQTACWLNHIVVIFLSTNSNSVLTAILSKYIEDPKQLCAATNRFLAISPDVISAEIPERVKHLAKLIMAKGVEYAKRFANMTAEEALSYILDEKSTESNDNKPIKLAFEQFMETFGHRCYNEFELEAKPWREEPTKVVEMIQRNCLAFTSQNNGEQKTETEDNQRDRTIDDVIKSLNIADLALKDKLLIKHVLAPRSQQFLSLRERAKNILVMHSDITRECSRLLAKEMVQNQRIPDENLLYYIGLNELKPLIMNHQPTIVMQANRRRQLFKQVFSETWKFDEVFTELIPNHLKPTKELDEAIARAPKLFGTPASSGKVRGRICRVDGYKDLDKVRPGTILLTHSTDIAFSIVFPMISGIITEVGGLVSHGAVVAREYGLPSLIGIPDVMQIIQDNEEIILDADNGTIVRLDMSQSVEQDDDPRRGERDQ